MTSWFVLLRDEFDLVFPWTGEAVDAVIAQRLARAAYELAGCVALLEVGDPEVSTDLVVCLQVEGRVTLTHLDNAPYTPE